MAGFLPFGAPIDFEDQVPTNFVLPNTAGASVDTYLSTIVGKITYDTTNNVIKYRDNTGTKTLATTADVGATTLDGLTDVTITSVADNNIIYYDLATTQWKNAAVGGDLTMVDGAFTVAKLQTKTLTMAGAATGFTLTMPTTSANYTFPSATSTLATLGLAETFTGAKTFSGNTILNGALSGSSVITSWGTPTDTQVPSALLVYTYINQQTTLGISYRPPVDLVYNNGAAALGAATNTIDGVTVTAGMRVLVVDSLTAGQDNMIMLSSGAAGSWVWTAQQDGTGADLPADGHTVWVKQGTAEGDTRWTFNGTAWVQISGTGTYTASTGVVLTGNDFRHVIDSATYAHVGSSGAATNTVLTYSALNGSGQVGTWGLLVNANIAASGTANIAWNKLATGTANSVMITGADGYPTVEATLAVARGGTGTNTLTDHGIMLGSGTGAVTVMAVGGANRIILGVASADPVWSPYSMPASFAAGDVNKILYVSSTSQLSAFAFGTANQILGMTAAATGYEYKTVSGTANRLGVTFAANSITLNIDTTLLPSPIAGDANKFLMATGANASTWTAITYTILPTDIAKYKKVDLLTATNTVTVTGTTHGCGEFPEVVLLRKKGTDNYIPYGVEIIYGAVDGTSGSRNITCNSGTNWEANSVLIIIGR